MSGTPSGGPKPIGTSLVSTLINSKHTTIINLGDSRSIGNGTTLEDKDAGGGKTPGGTNSVIRFDPNNLENKEEGVKNSDGTTGRPAQVGLAHELGHAVDGVNGKTDGKKIDVLDPDNNDGTVTQLGVDEIRIRTKIDNPVRAEQGAKQRAIPVIIK